MTQPTDPLFSATQRALAGQYSLERELGRGGMGVVYLAREVELDRLVALKVLPHDQAALPDVRDRFLREARMAASLSHPHVVPIHRVGETGDIVYFSMAFVDGETLGERLRARGPLSPSVATRMLREVAQALAYAHGRGIIHRDIKPDNILLERETGRALVSDFGIAATARDGATSGPVVGTTHFMSPEQAQGAPADARSDFYSLGVVGFLSLSGKLPRTDESLADASAVTPAHLVSAIDRALQHEPSARHATAEAFAEAVESHAVVRTELPAPLRQWLDARDPWQLPYVIWTAVTGASALIDLMRLGLGDAWRVLLLASLPIGPALLFRLRAARRVFDAGYTVEDVRSALQARQTERDLLHQPPLTVTQTPWWHPVARALAFTPIGASVWIASNVVQVRHYLGGPPDRTWLMPLAAISAVLALPLLNAMGVPILPRRVLGYGEELTETFWCSRVGRWAERLLMRGRKRGVPSQAFRPTESVLGSAVEDLFRALPTAYRHQLSELPGVIGRLQDQARRARESLAHFDGVTAVGRDAELSSARERARRGLTESVSALESVRLDLLRLAGGDADLRATTTVISAARRVSDDIARLNAAHREAGNSIRPLGLDLRPHSPA